MIEKFGAPGSREFWWGWVGWEHPFGDRMGKVWDMEQSEDGLEGGYNLDYNKILKNKNTKVMKRIINDCAKY